MREECFPFPPCPICVVGDSFLEWKMSRNGGGGNFTPSLYTFRFPSRLFEALRVSKSVFD